MTDSKKPEFREDDSWFSKEQKLSLLPTLLRGCRQLKSIAQMLS